LHTFDAVNTTPVDDTLQYDLAAAVEVDRSSADPEFSETHDEL
jgi:hypothetical protein